MPSETQNIFSEFDDPVRFKLIKQIEEQEPSFAKISRECFFALWFSDMTALNLIANSGRNDFLRYQMLHVGGGAENHPGMFARRKRVTQEERNRKRDCPNEASRSPESNQSDRDARVSVKQDVLKRDGRCVLTKQGLPTLHVTHIIPQKLHETRRVSSWHWLTYFWGEQKVNKWRSQIVGTNGTLNTKQMINMLALAPAVHACWDEQICAFRPLSVDGDKKTMYLAFHWLPILKKSIRRTDKLPIDHRPCSELLTNPQFCNTPGEGVFLFDAKTRTPIKTGHVFTIQTDDPERLPLPSFDLLEMQWHLTRICALQGTAEDEDRDYDLEDKDSDFDSDYDYVTISP